MNLPAPLHQRRRHSADQIRQILNEYRAGAITQSEVAARHGISVGTLQNWQRRYRTAAPDRPDPDWIEVIAAPPAAGGAYRVELAGGPTLVLGSGWRASEVRELLAILRAP